MKAAHPEATILAAEALPVDGLARREGRAPSRGAGSPEAAYLFDWEGRTVS